MAGGYYTALSGMRARMDALDRVASDIANASTPGYKTERRGTEQADRPSFDAMLKSAVDVVTGETRIDFRGGSLQPTGRSMDVAIEGEGFLAVETPRGTAYTRNGRLKRSREGLLATDEGDAVQGTSGPITIGQGEIAVDPDGTVREGNAVVGTLKVVQFAPGTAFDRDGGSRFRTAAVPEAVEKPRFTSGSLEQSNVQIVERVAELTEVSRNYQTLLRAVSTLLNDVDRGAINELGRR
jgi:flagellar basal-body rod protein FlgF